jgi:hypothetical protein
VIVFSECLSALTIEHGGKTSLGPDILVSYHDKDHYNSVRDIRVGKPSPVVRTLVKSETGEMSAEYSDEPTIQEAGEQTEEQPSRQEDRELNNTRNPEALHLALEEHHQSDTSKTETKTKGSKEKTKKNAQCPCGSGIRYKKCCRPKDKHEKRVKEYAKGELHVQGTATKPFEVDGAFRVLKI